MKAKINSVVFVLILIIFNSKVQSQISNTGFENWANGDPVSWFTTDIPGQADAVSQTSDSHSGSSAARLEVKQFINLPYPPSLQAGGAGVGVPLTNRPAAITGYYKQSPLNNDALKISVIIRSGISLIGAVSADFHVVGNSFTQFTLPIAYVNNEIPTQADVVFSIHDSTTSGVSTVGSWAILDDITFTGSATDVNDISELPTSYSLDQNYPNPFNPSTTIKFSLPEKDFVKVTVHNLIGEEVERIVNSELSAGVHTLKFDAFRLSSGIYFYRMETSKFSSVKKMMLTK